MREKAENPRRRFRSVVTELRDPHSPVTLFMKERFGLRKVQKRYRVQSPELVVPGSMSAGQASVLGTAADWLMRFLVHPTPSLMLAKLGAGNLEMPGTGIPPASIRGFDMLEELQAALGFSRGTARFTGPVEGCQMEPERLLRACWALALLTLVYRAGPPAAAALEGVEKIMALAPPEGLAQLTALREVMERDLLPRLAERKGQWTLGPVFTGSHYMKGDGDLIAADLLLDLKTTVKPGLDGKDMFQLITYTLMDWDDEYKLQEFGFFNARYGYLATWDIDVLLHEIGKVTLHEARMQFRELLTG